MISYCVTVLTLYTLENRRSYAYKLLTYWHWQAKLFLWLLGCRTCNRIFLYSVVQGNPLHNLPPNYQTTPLQVQPNFPTLGQMNVPMGNPVPNLQPNFSAQGNPLQNLPPNLQIQGNPPQNQPNFPVGNLLQGLPPNISAQGYPLQNQPPNISAQGNPLQNLPPNFPTLGQMCHRCYHRISLIQDNFPVIWLGVLWNQSKLKIPEFPLF